MGKHNRRNFDFCPYCGKVVEHQSTNFSVTNEKGSNQTVHVKCFPKLVAAWKKERGMK